MNIYIDESGNFISGNEPSAWSLAVAVVGTESARRTIDAALAELRRTVGAMPNEEVKLDRVTEEQYQSFLRDLDKPSLVVFAAAVDASTQTMDAVLEHQRFHVQDIRAFVPKMHYANGRRGLEFLADQLEKLPSQLYVQLITQVRLLYEVIWQTATYYAQNHPPTLSSFRWHIDPKDKSRTAYEEAFLKMAPALLQARSIEEPMPHFRGLNYSFMERFNTTESSYPTYLHEEHGLPAMEGYDLRKILSESVSFPDSKTSNGIQAADLVARGLRRALKGAFDDPLKIASHLGRLTLRNGTAGPSIALLSLSRSQFVEPKSAAVIAKIGASSRPLIDHRRRLTPRSS